MVCAAHRKLTNRVGRTDFQVEEDTVDFNVPRLLPNQDESEYHVSRNFTYLARVVRNVSRMVVVYGRLKKSKEVKEWGLDPDFVQISPALDAWLAEIPADMSISYPANGSPPWLPSAFVGNVHSYYYLSIILFNRPQLAFLSPSTPGGQWKHHMLVSYNAAKMLCRLQEAVMGAYGLNGLLCMQRGINFTIYAVLACIVLHLVRRPFHMPNALNFFLLTSLLRTGCLDITRPRPELGSQGVLYAPHEDPGKVHELVAHAGHAEADRLGAGGLFCGRPEAVRAEAQLPVRQPAFQLAPQPARAQALGHAGATLAS